MTSYFNTLLNYLGIGNKSSDPRSVSVVDGSNSLNYESPPTNPNALNLLLLSHVDEMDRGLDAFREEWEKPQTQNRPHSSPSSWNLDDLTGAN